MNDSKATRIVLPCISDQTVKIENQEKEKQQIKACSIGKQKQNTSKSVKENLTKISEKVLSNFLLEGDQVSYLNLEKI